MEARDSLSEEISRNLEENVAEHEVVTWTVVQPRGDTVKVERVTERVRSRDCLARSKTKKEEVRVIRDTVVVEHRDTVIVEKTRGQTPAENRRAPWLSALRWIFWIIVGLIVLTIVFKFVHSKG